MTEHSHTSTQGLTISEDLRTGTYNNLHNSDETLTAMNGHKSSYRATTHSSSPELTPSMTGQKGACDK